MRRIDELTPREVAHQLGVRLDSVYALLWAGKLPGRKHEGRWVIPVEAVKARLKARRANAR